MNQITKKDMEEIKKHLERIRLTIGRSHYRIVTILYSILAVISITGGYILSSIEQSTIPFIMLLIFCLFCIYMAIHTQFQQEKSENEYLKEIERR